MAYTNVHACNWVWDAENNKAPNGPAQSVYLALARHANQQKEAWPSIYTLCKLTKFSRTAVKDALAELKNVGEIEDTGERKGATQQIVVYKLPNLKLPSDSQYSSPPNYLSNGHNKAVTEEAQDLLNRVRKWKQEYSGEAFMQVAHGTILQLEKMGVTPDDL